MYGYLTVGERRVLAADQVKGAKHVTLQRSHFLSISSALKPEPAARGGSTLNSEGVDQHSSARAARAADGFRHGRYATGQ